MITRTREIVERRSILRLLIARDLKIKYADSALGYVWSVLDPLMMALVYWFVFSVIFERAGIGEKPYIVFLLVGLLAWNFANGVMTDSSRAINAEAKLVRSSNLPREIWVLRIVGSKLAEFVLSWPVLLGFMAVFGVGFSYYVAFWPLAMLIQLVFLTGLALILAPVTVMMSDIDRLVRISLRVLFYMTPVIYGIKDLAGANIPPLLVNLYVLNPLAGIIDLYRAALFPDSFQGWHVVAIASAVSFGTLLVGAFVFSKLEGAVLKEI